MASPIVFGSPEARAILEADRERQKREEEEEKENSVEALTKRLNAIESDIDYHENELGWLKHDRDEIRAKLADKGVRVRR